MKISHCRVKLVYYINVEFTWYLTYILDNIGKEIAWLKNKSKINTKMAAKPVTQILPPIPPEYKYNNLIADLSKKITAADMTDLKERFRDLIPQHVTTPRAMFDKLEETGFIDGHNILFIQQIIRVLDREDLLEIAAKYTKLYEEDDLLHFFKKTHHLADGRDIVEFHVVGHKISNRRDLENFRIQVSTCLLVPLHEVIVKGVQETGSTLIALMLPIKYVEFLRHQLEGNKQYMIESFMKHDVDEARFSTQHFKLKTNGTHFLAEKTEILNVQNGQSTQNKAKRPESMPHFPNACTHVLAEKTEILNVQNGQSTQNTSKRQESMPHYSNACKKGILHVSHVSQIEGMA